MSTLADRVAAYLADHPDGDLSDRIARAVRGRYQTVRDLLDTDPRFHSSPRNAWPSDTARLYRLAPTMAGEGPGRPSPFKPGTQCARLLAVLADGRWHTTRELLQAVPSIVHSRVAELRRHGYQVEHETTGAGAAGSRYRLTGTLLEQPPPVDLLTGQADPAAAGGGCSSSVPPSSPDDGRLGAAQQLAIEVAA